MHHRTPQPHIRPSPPPRGNTPVFGSPNIRPALLDRPRAGCSANTTGDSANPRPPTSANKAAAPDAKPYQGVIDSTKSRWSQLRYISCTRRFPLQQNWATRVVEVRFEETPIFAEPGPRLVDNRADRLARREVRPNGTPSDRWTRRIYRNHCRQFGQQRTSTIAPTGGARTCSHRD